MSALPPAFENVDKCRKCGTSFGLITRKHHCRNCGRTFCEKCSSRNAKLPHFGINEPVRVCDECDNTLKNSKPAATTASSSSSSSSSSSEPAPAASSSSSSSSAAAKKVANCKCGMPLCVCPPDATAAAPSSSSSSTTKATSAAPSSASSSATAKKPASSASSSSSSSFSGFSSQFSSFSSSSTQKWNLNGDLNEQLREALKSGDNAGALQLLTAGADAKFVDKTGNTLLHMAAMFNRTEMVVELMKRGASPTEKNPSGETPLDVAPPALAHKMKQLAGL